MASDTGQLKAAVQRLERVEKVISGDWTAAGHKVGQRAKREAKAVAGEVTGGSGRLTHMGRGATLSSGYDLEEQGKRLIFKLRPPGPWVIMEQGAKPHAIGPRGSKGRTVFGGLMFGGGQRANQAPGYEHPVYRVHHPGMRQKRGAIRKTFSRVRDMATPVYHDEMVKQIGEIYG